MNQTDQTSQKPAIAIAGFPEVGKTTLLTRLQASEVAEAFDFVELPRVVMLGRNTPEEQQAYDYLLGRDALNSSNPPFGIISIVDVTALSRQLYLSFQLIDLRLPFLLALRGVEAAARAGTMVDLDKLAELLGVKVIALGDESEQVVHALRQWRDTDVEKVVRKPAHWRPSVALADAYQHLDSKWIHKHLPLYTGARLVEGLRLLTVPKAVEEYEGHPAYKSLLRYLDEARQMLEDRKEKWTTAEVIQRNKWITQALQSSLKEVPVEQLASDKKGWWRSLFAK